MGSRFHPHRTEAQKRRRRSNDLAQAPTDTSCWRQSRTVPRSGAASCSVMPRGARSTAGVPADAVLSRHVVVGWSLRSRVGPDGSGCRDGPAVDAVAARAGRAFEAQGGRCTAQSSWRSSRTVPTRRATAFPSGTVATVSVRHSISPIERSIGSGEWIVARCSSRGTDVGERVPLGPVAKDSAPRKAGAEPVGDLAARHLAGLRVVLGEDDGDEGGDPGPAGSAGTGGRVAQQEEAAALPGSVRRRAARHFEGRAGVGDDQHGAARAAAREPGQEGGPERLGLGRADLRAERLVPSVGLDAGGEDPRGRDDATTRLAGLDGGGIELQLRPTASDTVLRRYSAPGRPRSAPRLRRRAGSARSGRSRPCRRLDRIVHRTGGETPARRPAGSPRCVSSRLAGGARGRTGRSSRVLVLGRRGSVAPDGSSGLGRGNRGAAPAGSALFPSGSTGFAIPPPRASGGRSRSSRAWDRHRRPSPEAADGRCRPR